MSSEKIKSIGEAAKFFAETVAEVAAEPVVFGRTFSERRWRYFFPAAVLSSSVVVAVGAGIFNGRVAEGIIAGGAEWFFCSGLLDRVRYFHNDK